MGSKSRSACSGFCPAILGAVLISAALLAATPAASSIAPADASRFPGGAARWSPLPLLYDESALALAQPDPETPATEAAPSPGPGEETRSRTGAKKALLLSLLVPGAGEWALGERGRARGFFITEGAIWAHFAWFQIAGGLRRDDYIEQARRSAGIGVNEEGDDYWRNVGLYATSSGTGPQAYEETLRREARDLHPSDPAAQDAWVAERLPTGDRAWEWVSPERQQAYQDTRERSRRAFDRSKYSIAAAILNRLISAVDTQIVSRKRSREDQAARSGGATSLAAGMAPDGSGRIVITRTF